MTERKLAQHPPLTSHAISKPRINPAYNTAMLYSYVYMFLLVLSALCATVVAKGGSLGNLLSGIMPSASLASGFPLSERRNALSFLTMEQRRGLFLRGLEIVPQYPFCREAPSLTLSPHSSPVRFRIVLWARERANQFTVIKTS